MFSCSWQGDGQKDKLQKQQAEAGTPFSLSHSLTPVVVFRLLEAGMFHHAGEFFSRWGCVLQIWVDLIEPVSVRQLLSGCHIIYHFLSISQPCQLDLLWIEVVRAADKQHLVAISLPFDWSYSDRRLHCRKKEHKKQMIRAIIIFLWRVSLVQSTKGG